MAIGILFFLSEVLPGEKHYFIVSFVMVEVNIYISEGGRLYVLHQTKRNDLMGSIFFSLEPGFDGLDHLGAALVLDPVP